MSIFTAAAADVWDALSSQAGSDVATITDRTGSTDKTGTGTARVIIRYERPADAPDLQFASVAEPRIIASVLRADLSADLRTGDIITIPAGDRAGRYRVDKNLVPKDGATHIAVPVMELD